MIDSFGRKIDYLRISVTDRCNLRCSYCMPKGVNFKLQHGDILSYEQILYLADIFYDLGIRKIKVTGGEPLVRENVSKLIKKLKEKFPFVSLTTNGVLIEKYFDDLLDCKLDGINISLDSLDRKTYENITGFDSLDKVLKGISLAKKLTDNVKINTVLLSDDIFPIAKLAKDDNIAVRFIEVMPIGENKAKFTNEQAKEILENNFGKLKESNFTSNGPSKYYNIDGFVGKVGFISPISDIFCERCNKVRLLADGELKSCLSYPANLNLKKMLDDKKSVVDIKKEIEKVIYNKPASHNFLTKKQDESGMFEIGG